MLLLLIQLRFRPTMHLKMTIRTSVLWKIGKKMARNGHKMAICELWFFNFFSYKIEKNRNDKNCVLCHSFWSNRDLNMLSTSKEQSEPQSYEKYLCNCQKKLARNGLKIANSLGCAFHFESEFKRSRVYIKRSHQTLTFLTL